MRLYSLLFFAVMLSLISNSYSSVFGQKRETTFQMSGIVKDASGLKLVGVSIYLKDQPGIGTATNLDGEFSVNASKGSTLMFKFLGFEDQEYLVLKEDKNLQIVMRETSSEIEEVVVTALGTQKKVSVVGAITTVKVADLNVPATSISNVLAGRVPGIISLQESGEPGRNLSDFWIRGISTFGYSAGALVLIDGLEGDLNQIDPSDIQSFSVLKDASATAVYGVKGANGVILITTKRGGEDKLRITARSNFSVSYLSRLPDYLGAFEYAKLANEARELSGLKPMYGVAELELIKYNLDPDLYPNVNWREEILHRNSFLQSHYISGQGGGSIARYFMSMGMSNESSAYKQDKGSLYRSPVGYNKYTYRLNLDVKMTKSTTVYMGVDGFVDSRQRPGFANTKQLWYLAGAFTPLTIPKQYSDGQIPTFGPENEYSPYVMLNHTGAASDNSFRNLGTVAIKQDLSFILPGLNFRVQGSMDYRINEFENRYLRPALYSASGRAPTGELLIVKRSDALAAKYGRTLHQSRKFHFESTLNYNKKFNKIHDLSGLIYYYMSDTKNTRWELDGLNNIPQRYQGISSRITYGLMNTYFLDLNFGYTGSENFQPGRQFGFFPSIAGGITPSQYKWVQEKLPWIDYFKLRYSYGVVGNDRIARRRFPYLTLINTNAKTGMGFKESGLTEKTIGADNLLWERAVKSDLGVEARLFRDKLSFTVDFFKDVRNNIFQQRTEIPLYIGSPDLPFGNVGKMHSYGSDGNIAYSQKIGNDFSFTVRGNFTYAVNMVDYWEQAEPPYPYMSKSNQPYGVRRGLIALGLFRDIEDVKASPPQFGVLLYPGDIKYKDVNGDGVVNSDDVVPISYSKTPRLMYGFGGEVKYKNLTVGVLMRGTGKVNYFQAGAYNESGWIPFWEGQKGNVLSIASEQKNRWTPAWYSGDPSTENPNAIFPRMKYGGNTNSGRLSTFWKRDGSYIRLQEVSVNYRFHSMRLLTALGASSVDLQLIGQNLYSFDKVKLFDPEQAEKNGGEYPIPARIALQMYINF